MKLNTTRKRPLAEVIKEVFSVIKLAKIFKKTYATTSVYSYGGFGRAFNGNSTQQKKMGSSRLLRIFFHRFSYKVLTHRGGRTRMHWAVKENNSTGPSVGDTTHRAILIGLGI